MTATLVKRHELSNVLPFAHYGAMTTDPYARLRTLKKAFDRAEEALTAPDPATGLTPVEYFHGVITAAFRPPGAPVGQEWHGRTTRIAERAGMTTQRVRDIHEQVTKSGAPLPFTDPHESLARIEEAREPLKALDVAREAYYREIIRLLPPVGEKQRASGPDAERVRKVQEITGIRKGNERKLAKRWGPVFEAKDHQRSNRAAGGDPNS